VVVNGRRVGTIIYDSKDHSRWQNAFTRKLRDDQIQSKATHAVLCTNVFPSGEKYLCAKDGVLVVDIHRVGVLASILRQHIIQMSNLRLADDDRRSKKEQLYSFITSEQCHQLWERFTQICDEIAAVESAETLAHRKTWDRRAALLGMLR